MADQVSDFSDSYLLVTKPDYVFVDRVLKEVANQQILSRREFKKFAKSLKVLLDQKRIYFGEPIYYRICDSLERHPLDFKEDLFNSILMDMTLIDPNVEIAEDTDDSVWIILSQSKRLYDAVADISCEEQLHVEILNVEILNELMKELNTRENLDENIMKDLENFNSTFNNSRNRTNYGNEINDKTKEITWNHKETQKETSELNE